jgi:hypothetical protein
MALRITYRANRFPFVITNGCPFDDTGSFICFTWEKGFLCYQSLMIDALQASRQVYITHHLTD